MHKQALLIEGVDAVAVRSAQLVDDPDLMAHVVMIARRTEAASAVSCTRPMEVRCRRWASCSDNTCKLEVSA